MAQEALSTNGDPVTVRCFHFSNPLSVNGPAGAFQFWIDGNNVLGRMTIGTLFGLGSTTLLNLAGTSSGTDPIVCTLQGEGFSTQQINVYEKPVSTELSITVQFASDWSQGSLFLGGIEPSGGLPVKSATCPPLESESD